ncbi:FAD-dependent oxidoreductase [Erythrobacter alti]|uniref:NAD(P)/FAD-dependent oxidoreductase n=1 Tax=Erythrobacter alti TaxID=1896145 RepID=UPI0030F48009
MIDVDKSGWTKHSAPVRRYAELQEDLSTDVCVVGAGLAGTSLALHLAEAQISVVVLEARQPGWGASGRNAGHVLPTLKSPEPFSHFKDEGRQFFDEFAEHKSILLDLQEKYEFDADAVRSGYLNVATSSDAIRDFRASHSWMIEREMLTVEEIGGANLSHLTGTPAWSHALNFVDGGRVNPYLMTNGMAQAASNLGARIMGGSEALSIEPAGLRWCIRTRNGSVTADKIVFCTNAYPTDIIPQFANSFYPLTAYGLTTKPLSSEARQKIMPGGQTLAQVPIDLNPMVIDGHGRLVLSSIPAAGIAEDAAWHFANQQAWIRYTWPDAPELELETYWTGRVAMRDQAFPGMFQVQPGLYGLMHFNAWGNIMAPLMGKLLAQGLASDDLEGLSFPIDKPQAVSNIGKQDRIIRHLLLPSARQAQRWGII